jgi:hypothetical protein
MSVSVRHSDFDNVGLSDVIEIASTDPKYSEIVDGVLCEPCS